MKLNHIYTHNIAGAHGFLKSSLWHHVFLCSTEEIPCFCMRCFHVRYAQAIYIRGRDTAKGRLSTYHYNDFIMSAMASQITGVMILCSTVSSGADHRKIWKLCVTGLWDCNSTVTAEFHAQKGQQRKKSFHWMMSSSTKMISAWQRCRFEYVLIFCRNKFLHTTSTVPQIAIMKKVQ